MSKSLRCLVVLAMLAVAGGVASGSAFGAIGGAFGPGPMATKCKKCERDPCVCNQRVCEKCKKKPCVCPKPGGRF